MICQVQRCQDDGEPRYLAKPVGSYSIAGAQYKASATELPPLCDEHWGLVRFNLSQGVPL